MLGQYKCLAVKALTGGVAIGWGSSECLYGNGAPLTSPVAMARGRFADIFLF